MRLQFTALALTLLCLGGRAWAQDVPRTEIFGGFSLLSVGGVTRNQVPGWQGSFAFNAHENLGLVVDVGGQYNNGGGAHQFLAGPRFSARMENATPFVHALLGLTKWRAGGHLPGFGGSNNNLTDFTVGIGGGVDWKVSNRFGVRLAQFDWLPSRYSVNGVQDWSTSNIRLGVGFVVGLGG
jgi:hypothetical protein